MKRISTFAAVLAACLIALPVQASGETGILNKTKTQQAAASTSASSSTPTLNGAKKGGTASTVNGIAPTVKSVGKYGEKYALVGKTPVVLPPDDSELAQPTFAKTKTGGYEATYKIDRKKTYSANDQAVIAIIDSWNQPGGKQTVSIPTKNGTKSVTGTFSSADAKAIFMSVNEKRAAAKVGTLSWNPALYKAAIQRAAEISNYNSHTRPDGSSFTTAGQGINGENIADGYATAQIAMNEWMISPGHKANILRQTFRDFAAAAVVVNGHPYWVQEFGGY